MAARSWKKLVHVEEFARRNYLLLVLIALVALLGFSALQAVVPKPVLPAPQPIDGYYDYQPGVGLTSTYRISYSIPNPINITQSQTLTLMFNASSLVGFTSAVDVHSANVTIATTDNTVLFQQIIRDDEVLTQGQVWGPKQIQFIIDNQTLQLSKGSEVTAKVLISVSFDEVLKVAYVIGTYQQDYTKLASVPALQITICSPYAAVIPVVQFDLQQLLVTGLLVGGGVWVVWGLIGYAQSMPRYDPRLAGPHFRDPTTGQIMSRGLAYKAFLIAALGLVFALLSQIGMPAYQLNLTKMLTAPFVGQQDLEALFAAGLWISGTLLSIHRR
jgi:hypothetical protein